MFRCIRIWWRKKFGFCLNRCKHAHPLSLCVKYHTLRIMIELCWIASDIVRQFDVFEMIEFRHFYSNNYFMQTSHLSEMSEIFYYYKSKKNRRRCIYHKYNFFLLCLCPFLCPFFLHSPVHTFPITKLSLLSIMQAF